MRDVQELRRHPTHMKELVARTWDPRVTKRYLWAIWDILDTMLGHTRKNKLLTSLSGIHKGYLAVRKAIEMGTGEFGVKSLGYPIPTGTFMNAREFGV